MTSRSMAMSAEDFAPSSMNTPSVWMVLPSSRMTDSTLSLPIIDLTSELIISTPALDALITTFCEALMVLYTQYTLEA